MILLIDLNNLVHAAWHGTRGHGAAKLAASWCARWMRVHEPTHVAAAVDRPWPTWRHDLAPKLYKVKKGEKTEKSDRSAILSELLIAEALLGDVLGVRVVGAKGFEGDDIIATLTRIAREAELDAMIITRDKDFCQLVTPNVRLLEQVSGEQLGVREVVEKFGVKPEQFVDYLAIVGDSSDGFPGCPGLGPVAARELLARFGSVEAVLESALGPDELGPKGGPGGWWNAGAPGRRGWRKKLVAGAESTRLSARLARLREDVPVGIATIGILDDFEALPVPVGAFC